MARAGLCFDEVQEAAEGRAGGLEVRGEGPHPAELLREGLRVQLHLPQAQPRTASQTTPRVMLHCAVAAVRVPCVE